MNFIIAAAAVLAGIDKIFGNRLGIGKRFDEGFRLLGPLVAGMTGILYLSPILARVLQDSIAPVFGKIGLDPGILGGILPTDMGGFQLAQELAADPNVGRMAGVFITSVFGCTFVFAIPVGFSMMKEERKPDFLLGILFGLMMLPVPVVLGGLCCGLSLGNVLLQSLPFLLITLLLIPGMRFRPAQMIRIFTILTKLIDAVSVFGILAGLVEYLTGYSLLPGAMPMREAIAASALCGLIMIGSLPFADILSRLFHKPLHVLGKFIGMRDSGITVLLLTLVSLPASFAVMHDEDRNGVVLNAAFLVIAASVFGPHMAVCTTGAPDLVPAFILVKLFSGLCTVFLTGLFLRKQAS